MTFVPAHLVVEGAGATRTAFVLHGILGSAKNWRVFARRMAERWPRWRFVLVDLRNHGESHGAPPPHTLEACAADLASLAAQVGDPHAVMGHSFGGKVALAYLRDVAPPTLERVWVLDAVPGPSEPHDVERVIAGLRQIPTPVASREALTAQMQGDGWSRELAGWMTTNLRPVEGGFTWRFDLDAIEAMLADYAAADLWPVVEHPVGPAVEIVRAGKSDRWTPEVLARLDDLPPRAGVHVLPDAGHWLHVDDPQGLLEILGHPAAVAAAGMATGFTETST